MISCLLCGVGGQGTVLASRVIAQTALREGLFARTAETIGMAQRGGCVVSHVRFGHSVHSPLIPPGGADLILGFEPGEAVRCLPFLKKGGLVVASTKPVWPASGARYDAESVLRYLSAAARLIEVDADAITQASGSGKTLNIAMVGAAAGAGELGLSIDNIIETLTERLPERSLAMNLAALRAGTKLTRTHQHAQN